MAVDERNGVIGDEPWIDRFEALRPLHKALAVLFATSDMGESRRCFVRRAAVGALTLVAGCMDARQSGNESPLSATTTEIAESDSTVIETAEATAPSGPQTTVGDARYVGKFGLWNDDDEPHSVVVSVATGESTLLEDTYEIEGDSAMSIANPITEQGSYRIRVETESGAANTFTWEILSCNNYEYIQIYIDETSEVELRKLKQTSLGTPTCSTQTTDSGG